jgi:hypothetical protein
MIQEKLERWPRVCKSRIVHGGIFAGVLCVDIGSLLDQELDDGEILSCHSLHQGSSASLPFCIDIRSILDQQAGDGRFGGQEGRVAPTIVQIGIGSMRQQEFDGRQMTAQYRPVQRSIRARHGIGISSMLQQSGDQGYTLLYAISSIADVGKVQLRIDQAQGRRIDFCILCVWFVLESLPELSQQPLHDQRLVGSIHDIGIGSLVEKGDRCGRLLSLDRFDQRMIQPILADVLAQRKGRS